MKKSSVARLLATGFGAGYLPIAPGTWGSALALLLAGLFIYLVPDDARWLIQVLCVVSTVLGIPASTIVSRQEGEKDPSIVVVDEIAGQFLAFLFLPLTWYWLIAAFFVFRLFDIVKPFPARQVESLPEGWGIMLDDLVVGAYSGLLLMIVGWFLVGTG